MKKGREQLVLTMTVDNAPENAETPVPFTLKDADGNSWTFDIHVSVRSGKPANNELFGNYPNPFNPSTTILYSLGKSGHAELAVFNSLGQKIRTLAEGLQAVGAHTVQWDGFNESGQRVSSGVYFYRMRSGMPNIVLHGSKYKKGNIGMPWKGFSGQYMNQKLQTENYVLEVNSK